MLCMCIWAFVQTGEWLKVGLGGEVPDYPQLDQVGLDLPRKYYFFLVF